MLDPLALVPYAAAAGGGHVDDVDSARLVAAGLTLLQRSAPLVRALAGRRSGILLPTHANLLVAVAASEGRGALLLDPRWPPALLRDAVDRADVGAVFTLSRLLPRISFLERMAQPVVLLDEAPHFAQVVTPERTARIDLGAHFGLSLEGRVGAAGSDEECVVLPSPVDSRLRRYSHRYLLHDARRCVDRLALTSTDRVELRFGTGPRVGTRRDGDGRGSGVLPLTLALATLLGGGRVLTRGREAGASAGSPDAMGTPTVLIASASACAAMAVRAAPSLRAVYCVGPMPATAVLSAVTRRHGLPVLEFPSTLIDREERD